MINQVTGEISFRSGLHIVPHQVITSPHRTVALSLKGWMRHILGIRPSEHGDFEVEALSKANHRILLVMLSHEHSFYEKNTPADAERRTFHEGVISTELAGQREFSWGEVLCRFESAFHRDYLVIAYSRDANIPLADREVLLRLLAHEKMPE
jgi:hypothetical protein